MTAWHIYGLRSPGGQIRYVGYSADPAARFKRHIASARAEKPRYLVHRWLKSVMATGAVPEMVILESGVNADGWQAAERAWIEKLSANRLLNATEGGLALPQIPPEARARSAEKLKSRVFTPEHRARISAAKTGVPRSDADEVRARLAKVAQGNRGRAMNLSEEERKRRSAAGKHQGAVNAKAMWASMTEAQRAQRSEAARRQMIEVWAQRKGAKNVE